MKKLIFLIVTIQLITGCAVMNLESGKPVPNASFIKKNKTTRAEVLQRCGAPQVIDSTSTAAYGNKMLVYEQRQTEGKFFGLPVFVWLNSMEYSDTAIFLFDDNGILTDFERMRRKTGYRNGWALLGNLGAGILIK